MWNLFGKKDKGIRINDFVWMNSASRNDAAASYCQQYPGTVAICWFEDSLQEWEQYCSSHQLSITSYLGSQVHHQHTGEKYIFLEHYPLIEKEQQLFERLQLKEVNVYNSLDDLLFSIFGGDQIRNLMNRLGMDPKEMIQHKLITESIRKAQEKLAKKHDGMSTPRTKEDWKKD